jgi:hypothetical protein
MPMPFCLTCGGRVYPGSVRCPQCGDLVPPDVEPPPQPVLYAWSGVAASVAIVLSLVSMFPDYAAGETLHGNPWTLWFNVVILITMGIAAALLLAWRQTRPPGAALVVGLGVALAGNYLIDWSVRPYGPGFWFGQIGEFVLLLSAGLALAALVEDETIEVRLTGRHRAFAAAGLGVAVLFVVSESLQQYRVVETAQAGYLFGTSPTSAASIGRIWDYTGLTLAGSLLSLVVTLAVLLLAGLIEPVRSGAAMVAGVLVLWASNLLSTLILVSKESRVPTQQVASVKLTLASGAAVDGAAIVVGVLVVAVMAMQRTPPADPARFAVPPPG